MGGAGGLAGRRASGRYDPSYARFAPGLVNAADDVGRALAALRSIA